MTPSPHDALCKDVYSDPARMASLLRATLPARTLAHLDLSTLRLLPGSYVDPSLRETRSDLLYEVRGVEGCAVLLHVLFEHKSRPERFVALDLLSYEVDIWRDLRKRDPTVTHLPAILPLVLYHGAERWTAPEEFGELLDLSEEARVDLAGFLPVFRYQLRDLSRLTEAELRAQVFDAFDRLTQLLLRHGQNLDLLERLAGWRHDLAEVAAQSGLRAIRVFLSYLGIVLGQPESEPVRRLLVEALGPQGKEVFMTWQEHIEARGRAEGEARGRAEGLRLQRTMVRDLLEQRFGALPAEAAARVETADEDQLSAWSRRLLRVGSLGELFER